jgi:hypothetical protein
MWMLLTTKSKEHSSSSTDMSDVTSTLDKLTSAPKILTNLKCSILYVTLTLEAFRLDKRRKNVPKFKKNGLLPSERPILCVPILQF